MKHPATNAGGNPGAPTHPALAGLPDKVRVHALGKLLDRSSREILDVLTGLGEPARSAQSSLDRDLALRVAETLLADGVTETATTTETTTTEPETDDVELASASLTPVFAAPAPVFLPPTPPAAPVRAKPQRQPEPAASAMANAIDAARAMTTINRAYWQMWMRMYGWGRTA